MTAIYYHGGARGLRPGDRLEPRPGGRHRAGCPICDARAQGLTVTVNGEAIDPPNADPHAVYVTRNRLYAKHYAALADGWLYTVRPIGEVVASAEDPAVEAYRCAEAEVVKVVERAVRLSESERRRLWRLLGGTVRDYAHYRRAVPYIFEQAAVQMAEPITKGDEP